MDRRTSSFSRAYRFFTAYWLRIVYQAGRRMAAQRLASEIDRLNQALAESEQLFSESESDLAAVKKKHARQLQETSDAHQQEVRELKRQIAVLQDSVDIKQQHNAQLSEIIARDRERVAAELAEASRRIEELTHDPNATARPVNQQR